jgi:hypothetical protein
MSRTKLKMRLSQSDALIVSVEPMMTSVCPSGRARAPRGRARTKTETASRVCSPFWGSTNLAASICMATVNDAALAMTPGPDAPSSIGILRSSSAASCERYPEWTVNFGYKEECNRCDYGSDLFIFSSKTGICIRSNYILGCYVNWGAVE